MLVAGLFDQATSLNILLFILLQILSPLRAAPNRLTTSQVLNNMLGSDYWPNLKAGGWNWWATHLWGDIRGRHGGSCRGKLRSICWRLPPGRPRDAVASRGGWVQISPDLSKVPQHNNFTHSFYLAVSPVNTGLWWGRQWVTSHREPPASPSYLATAPAWTLWSSLLGQLVRAR